MLTDAVLAGLSREFDKLYARDGRPSIPPERLLRALLLQAFYTVRSERQLMEQLDYNLLFRWFVGLSADDPVWDATVFCKNRDRLLDGDIAAKFFAGVLNLPQVCTLLSSEHFSVDGTLIEAWASMKSFVPKADGKPPSPGGGGRNAERNFRGEKRTNDTHASTTDPDARLFRKGLGKEAKLCHMGHVMMENRNNLIVDARLTEANGTAEPTTALDMIERQCQARQHSGGRQALRHRRLRRRLPRTRLHPACRTERHEPPLGDRWPHDPTSWLCHQHDQAKAYRRALWLDQNDRRLAKDPPPGTRPDRMVLCPHRRRLQSDPYPKASADRGMKCA